MYSPDGNWWWNGSQWVPVAAPPAQRRWPVTNNMDRYRGDSCSQWIALSLILVFGFGTLLMVGIAVVLLANSQVLVGLFTLGMGLFLVIPLAVGVWLAWHSFKRPISS
jgi:hypothetical protein